MADAPRRATAGPGSPAGVRGGDAGAGGKVLDSSGEGGKDVVDFDRPRAR